MSSIIQTFIFMSFQAFISLPFKFQAFTFQVFTFQALFFCILFYIVVSLFFLLILCHKEKCLGIHLPYISILRKYSFSKIFYHLFLKIKSFSKSFFFRCLLFLKVLKIKPFFTFLSPLKKKVKKIFFFKKEETQNPKK